MLKNLHPAWAALVTVAVGITVGVVIRLFYDLSWAWILAACALSAAGAAWQSWRGRQAAAQASP